MSEDEREGGAEDAYTRGLLDARAKYAQAWAEVTGRTVHPIEFSAEFLRDQLRGGWFEKRVLSDGTVPVVGQRVMTVREVAERWGLGHGHDDRVHEITGVLSGATGMVECGPRQISVAMLMLAPENSEVTCPDCAGWHARRESWRIDFEASRSTQFRVKEIEKERDELAERQDQLLFVLYGASAKGASANTIVDTVERLVRDFDHACAELEKQREATQRILEAVASKKGPASA